MADEPRIAYPYMRRNMRMWREQREHRVGPRALHVRLRQSIEQRHRLRAMPDIRFDRFPVLDEVDRGPVTVAVQLAPLVEGLMLFILDVRHQLGPLRAHDCVQLIGDLRSRRLDLLEPREGLARMEFPLGKFGE